MSVSYPAYFALLYQWRIHSINLKISAQLAVCFRTVTRVEIRCHLLTTRASTVCTLTNAQEMKAKLSKRKLCHDTSMHFYNNLQFWRSYVWYSSALIINVVFCFFYMFQFYYLLIAFHVLRYMCTALCCSLIKLWYRHWFFHILMILYLQCVFQMLKKLSLSVNQ